MSISLKEKIYKKMNKLTLASLATITPEKTPWVRYVTIFADKNLTIWFSTFATSKKVLHIKHSSDVHLVLGVTKMETANSYIQVQGKAKILNDKESKKKVWNEVLKNYFKSPDDTNMRVCMVKPYHIEFNDMNPSNKPEILTL